jgi:hypothetical protein
MNRLLQGDVGSGKTIVALMAILLAIDNGFQAFVEQMVADGRLQQWGQQVVLDEERPLP